MALRILVVEDHPANLELMTYLLEAFGYATLSAQDGEEGLATAIREEPDLIICDVQLPRLDGYRLAQELKRRPRLRRVPLVAVTAYAMVGDRDKVLASGFDGYIPKPINPETFVQQVAWYLLPGRASRPTLSSDDAAPAPPVAPKPHTILVTDNSPVNLDFALSLLQGSGYRVVTATGLAESLQALSRGLVDLILSDVRMGDGNGFDFIRAVKRDPRLQRVPFLFITSTCVTEQDRAEGLALGAARYLCRPIEPQVLLAEIESCLRGTASTPWP